MLRVHQSFFVVSFFSLVLALVTWAYSPGLSGDFLFDDYPNLEYLGHDGGVVDWPTFKSYILSGFAGPTGRPIALASFLLDDNTWPSKASYFKTTNLLIHLLTGVVLCWMSLLLLRLFGFDEKKATLIAILNMAIWLLHPFFVSTTLYIVQRMAQLAAMFMFAGITSYLYGRLILSRRPLAGYLFMSAGVTLGTLLAVLSKENGALLPLLVIIIEYCKPKKYSQATPKPDWRWTATFLWAPSIAICYYLISKINFSAELWPTRAFNQPERLLSQARILWEYLYYLWLPQIEGRGLYQDGYMVSRDLLSPPSTLLAVMGLGLLLTIAIVGRHRWPLISLGVLFFLSAHLIESTVIGLELYFEHRNYAATAFLFLPAAYGLVKLQCWLRPKFLITLVVLTLLLLATMTWQRSSLWQDADVLQSYWATNNTESPRAQHYLAMQLFQSGYWHEGMSYLEMAEQKLPDSSLLTIQRLSQQVAADIDTADDFTHAQQRMAQQPFDAQALVGIRQLAEYLMQTGTNEQRQYLLDLIEKLDENEHYQKISVYTRVSPYIKGQLLLAQGKIVEAITHLELAIQKYADTDTSLAIVTMLGIEGYPKEALKMLEHTELIFENQSARTLKRTRGVYRFEIDRIREILIEDIKAANIKQNTLREPRDGE